MKNYFTLLLSLVTATTALAQSEPQTLFNNGASADKFGFMVAPMFEAGQVDGSTATLWGARAGVVYADKISVGGFYKASANDITATSETLGGLHYDIQAAGAFLEYTLFAEKAFHLTIPVQIGGAEIDVDNETGTDPFGEQNFLLIEPGVMLEVNLHKYVRLNIGGTYRFTNSFEYRNINQSDVAGFNGHVGVKFGLFRS